VGITAALVPQQASTWLEQTNTTADYGLGWNEFAAYSNPYQYVAVPAFRLGRGVGTMPPALAALDTAALNERSVAGLEQAINAIVKYQFSQVYPTLYLVALDNYVAFNSSLINVHIQPSGTTTYLASVKFK
jgi:hypothetical protein